MKNHISNPKAKSLLVIREGELNLWDFEENVRHFEDASKSINSTNIKNSIKNRNTSAYKPCNSLQNKKESRQNSLPSSFKNPHQNNEIQSPQSVVHNRNKKVHSMERKKNTKIIQTLVPIDNKVNSNISNSANTISNTINMSTKKSIKTGGLSLNMNKAIDMKNPDSLIKYLKVNSGRGPKSNSIKNRSISNSKNNNNKEKDNINNSSISNNINNNENSISSSHNKANTQKILNDNNINVKSQIEDPSKADYIYTNLYKKKTFCHNYELQKKLKQLKDEEENQKEMKECTFKPKLYKNPNIIYTKSIPSSIPPSNQQNQNNQNASNLKNQKINSLNNNKINIYDKQNNWLNKLNAKKEKNIEMKMNKELENCSFIPKINKMQNLNYENYYNKDQVEKEIYLSKLKGDKIYYDKQKNKEKDFVKDYDARKRKNYDLYFNMNKDMVVDDNKQGEQNLNNVNNNMGAENNNLTNYKNNFVDLEFEKQKEKLMEDLHNWQRENSEEEEDEEQDDVVN